MKLLRIFSLVFVFTFASDAVLAQYKISQLIDENKVKIFPPYKYDGFVMNEFSFEQINKNITIEFVAFKGQKYKLLFCSSGFEENVMISIFDKANPSVKIKELVINTDHSSWPLEIEKSGTYSIVYEIPPSNTDIEHKACMVMLIGFTEK